MCTFIGGFSGVLGLLAGGLMIASVFGGPLRALWSGMRAGLAGEHGGARAAWRAGLLLALVVVLTAVVPMPFSTLAEGVVWLPEQAQIRAGTDGFVSAFAASSDWASMPLSRP